MSMRLMVQAMNCKVGNPARKLVLLKLADNANDDGICFPSYQYIADKCEMTRRSAINHIEYLIKMGLVSKKERKNKDGSISNLYFLHLEQGSENFALGSENISLGSENFALGGSENISPRTSHSLEPVNEPKKTTQKSEAEMLLEQFGITGQLAKDFIAHRK
ncbi:helix-turn-helix domain-containing protein, partial [Haemophilus influenzae]